MGQAEGGAQGAVTVVPVSPSRVVNSKLGQLPAKLGHKKKSPENVAKSGRRGSGGRRTTRANCGVSPGSVRRNDDSARRQQTSRSRVAFNGWPHCGSSPTAGSLRAGDRASGRSICHSSSSSPCESSLKRRPRGATKPNGGGGGASSGSESSINMECSRAAGTACQFLRGMAATPKGATESCATFEGAKAGAATFHGHTPVPPGKSAPLPPAAGANARAAVFQSHRSDSLGALSAQSESAEKMATPSGCGAACPRAPVTRV